MLPYELIPSEGGASYTFITDNGIEYGIWFDDTTQKFKKEDIGNSVIYEYQFFPISNGKPPYDERVMVTIMESIHRTLLKEENVILFICDSGDGKQKARSKYFDTQFKKYQLEHIYKVDGWVKSASPEIEKEYVSVIINKNNPHCDRVEKIFNIILDERDTGKNPMFQI